MNYLHKVLSAIALIFVFFTAPIGAQCPSDIVINLGPGECDAIVSYELDGSSCTVSFDASHVSGPTSGSTQGVGVHPVELSIDCDGVVSACTFDVTIIAYENPATSITCNDQVNISMDDDCGFNVTADMFLEGGPYGCYLNDYSVYFSSAPNDNVNDTQVFLAAGSYNVTVEDNATGNYCWGTFNVEDKHAPVLQCSELFITCIEAACGLPDELSFGVSVSSYLAAQNDCGAVSVISSSELPVPGDCEGISEMIYRTWLATDAAGNTTTCVQIVNIVAANLGSVSGSAGEIYSNDPFANTLDDPIALGEIRLPAQLLAKFGCGDDVTPEGIYDLCKVYEDDLFSTDCSNYAGQIAQHNLAVKAAYPHYLKFIPSRVGSTNCGADLAYYVPINYDLCNIFFNYTDQELELCENCPGNKKVIRTWSILDWCNAETDVHTQIIKAADVDGPTFVNFAEEMTVSANPWGCAATFVLPVPALHDNCDYETSYTVSTLTPGVTINGNIMSGLPKSMDPHRVIYTASDCCGNETQWEVLVTVVDRTPPVVITKENIVTSITSNPTTTGELIGVSKVFAASVDNSSHDGDCGPVRLAVRRSDGAPACDNFGGTHQNAPFNNNTSYFNFSNLNDALQPDNHDQHDTDEGQYVKFCCSDLDQVDSISGVAYGIHEIWLGVWDDGNMNGIPGDVVDGVWDNFNESWSNIRVENKLPAQIVAPANAWIECFNNPNDPSVIDITGRAQAVDLCESVAVSYTDVCGADLDGNGRIEDVLVFFEGHLVNETFNKSCNQGPIVRTWCVDGTNSCATQIIILANTGDLFDGCYDESTGYSIVWPYEGANDNIFDANGTAVAFENDYATCIANGGYAGYAEVQKTCLDDFDTNVVWSGEACSLLGHSIDSTVFHFEEGACQKIIYDHTVIDWCQYNPNDPFTGGIWTWTVVAKMIDDTAPELICEDLCIQVQPACSTTATLNAVSDDSGSDCPSEWISWSIFVDLWGDGTFDYEYSTFVPEDPSNGLWDDDNFNGIPDLRLGNGGLGSDADNLPNDRSKTTSGEVLEITIPEVIDGSKNNHRVQWNAFDGCGNVTTKTVTFQVLDKKAPTPYCVDLSTALMDNGTVELWACDFDLGSFDNCTSADWLRFSFGENDLPIASNPRYNEDSRCTHRVFTCDDFMNSTNGFVQINMTVWDECDNYDMCLVNLRLVDNNEACGDTGTRANIVGNVATEDGRNIADAMVEIESIDPSYPSNIMSDQSGMYAFVNNPMYLDYDIVTEKNDDYLNGVSTLDLVLIQRHILGLQNLNSGYKLVAADVNNDENISAIDLIELRKLILGIYAELPNNDSWRFLDAAQTLNNQNPWPIDEIVNVSSLDQNMTTENFVGIKVGDVNGNVSLLKDDNNIDSRSNQKLVLTIDEVEMIAGGQYDLAVKAENFNEVSGFQFTLETGNLELINVKSGAINITDANIAIHDNSATMVWFNEAAQTVNTDALFIITVKANETVNSTNAFGINSTITKAEAYLGATYETASVELRNDDNDSNFTLYQNEPNPFSEFTTIGFELPENGKATLNVFDVTGKLMTTIQADFVKGYNEIVLNSADFSTNNGVFYYQLESGNQSTTMKMIVIE